MGFLRTYITLYPNEAIDLMGNSPQGGYSVTDYLNAIMNYAPFGAGYYLSVGDQLLTLGYLTEDGITKLVNTIIYGSSRIGVHQTAILLRSRFANVEITITLEDVEYTSLYRGKRHYELSNHLGNVQVVVSDKRISVCDSELEVEYFKAEVLSAVDYYPFGMMMPDRQYYASNDSSNYAYGFQGQEKDDEIKGPGNSITFKYRIYDPRLARFFSVDPLTQSYPWYSPYVFSGNRVIDAIELEGLEPFSIALPRWFFEVGRLRLPTIDIPVAPAPPTIPIPPVIMPQNIPESIPLSPSFPGQLSIPEGLIDLANPDIIPFPNTDIKYLYQVKSEKGGPLDDPTYNGGYKSARPHKEISKMKNDAPHWAKGHKPRIGEDGKGFAKRLMDAKYGEGNWKKGGGTEYSEIQKWGQTHFKEVVPLTIAQMRKFKNDAQEYNIEYEKYQQELFEILQQIYEEQKQEMNKPTKDT